MTDQELKKFCLEIALSAMSKEPRNLTADDLIKEAKILYEYLKL